jgi:uncharacterized membrane protein YgcG
MAAMISTPARTALSVVLLCSLTSLAQTAISGTMTLTPQAFNQYGQYPLDESINLTCTLSCPTTAPTKHFGMATADYYFSETNTTFGYFPAGLMSAVDPTGSATSSQTSLPAGASYYVKLGSVTCWCGNQTGLGGYVDITSNTVHVAPYAKVLLVQPAGQQTLANVDASPQGSETVTVTVVGAGLNSTQTFAPADFDNNGAHTSKGVNFTATQAGDVTLTATLNPSGASYSTTATIPAGSGTGGGGGSTGGGGGGGGSSAGGCAAVPLMDLGPALLLLLARRRRSPTSPRPTRPQGR